MKCQVDINDLHFTYDTLQKPLFNGVSISFSTGWTSICGSNGCGKSTLLALIAEQLQPDAGVIQRNGTLAMVSQSTEKAPSGLNEFRVDYRAAAIRLREGLSIHDDWFDRWQSLSIGERKRLQLASTLASEPDILLIDEPTNHLDSTTKQLILAALQQYRGVGILISHDRLLLNELCQRTAFLDGGDLELIGLPYDAAKEQWQQQLDYAVGQKIQLKKKAAKLSRSVQKQNQRIQKGAAKLSKRTLAKKDHDAKEKINLAKLTGADLADSRKKQVLQHKLDRLGQKIDDMHVKKNYDLGVFFQKPPRVRPIHFPAAVHDFGYLSIKVPDVYLDAGDKIVISGDNGVGKSTLLSFWQSSLNQSYAYAPQEFSSSEAKQLSDELLAINKEDRGRIMTLVSCFGSDPKTLIQGAVPSPGVWQKIMIALAIVKAVPVLILDEPTNHMDLPAIEVLEEAIGKYQGIMICVSHDQGFIDKLCKKNLRLSKNQSITTADFLAGLS